MVICYRMGLVQPKIVKLPDRVHLPMLCHTAQLGWGVVLDRNPLGLWVVDTPQGSQAVKDASLQNNVAILRLGPTVSADEKLSFFSHVQQTLKLYRRELFEACVASAFIGFLALATSLFSMQVYDRVIPTRSEYTLAILSLGVLLSIVIELSMKYARSHLMDYVVVGLDNSLSREMFHRLLQLRVDQIPASVGSLAGQMRGYEQVRAFYTASTLFSLIDLPLAAIFIVVIMLVASPWVGVVPFLFGGIALLHSAT
jgi:ATP-binding cassette subfamily C protein LapB